jgi:ABC-type multidrug transport system fused ATPase/permease subunit
MATVEQSVVHDLRIRLFGHALTLDPSVHATDGVSSQGSRIIQEVKLAGQLVRLFYGQLFSQLTVILGLLAVSLAVDPLVAAITAIGLTCGLTVVRRPVEESRLSLKRAWEQEAALHEQAAEALGSASLLRVYDAESTAEATFRAGSTQVRERLIGAVKIHARALPRLEVALWGALLLGGLIAAWRWNAGVSSAAAYVTLFTSMLLMVRPLRSLAGLGHPLASGLAALDRINEIFAHPAEGDGGTATAPAEPGSWRISGGMVLGEPTPRLQGIDLELIKDESVAIVGASGAGKSTLLRVLLGLTRLDHGRVQVDGRELSDFSTQAWRSMFSWVPQTPLLLSSSVLQNVALGDANPDPERAQEALADAGAWDFVSAFPESMDTKVGSAGGRPVSVGEAQRICLARALYRQSPVLVLDEPTSALDADAEKAFIRTLSAVMKTRTVILSSHRKSLVLPVDRAVVLDAGRIVDDLSPHDLITQSGTYRSLVDRD